MAPAEEFQNQLQDRENCWPNSSTVVTYFQLTSLTLTPLFFADVGAAFAAAHLEAASTRQAPHHHRHRNESPLHLIMHSNEYTVYNTPYEVLKAI